MTKKSKSNRIKSYVEIRNEERLLIKEIISKQLQPKDRQAIINVTGLSTSTVYKALNKKDLFWSQKVINEAQNIISNRGGNGV